MIHRAILLIMTTAFCALGAPATARITRIEITATESPTFGGYAWPMVGQYEKIVGVAHGEVDPGDPKNGLITDIDLAPRNARGRVEYSFDFYILKPIDLRRGAHKVMYEPPNRGHKTWSVFGRVPRGDDPGSIIDPKILASAFLMPRGYTLVWSGWDKSAGPRNAGFTATITLPVAKHLDGSSITGPSYEYIVTGEKSYPLSYPAATLIKSWATLTHRVHLDDVPTVIPATGWEYNVDGTAISLTGGAYVDHDIYEFSYRAKDPTVNGLGLAAVRDFNAWLRYAQADDAGQRNPLAKDVQRMYAVTYSQPGRMLNDFRYLGFNEAENGGKVFDAMLQWLAAGDGLNLNYRFSQPDRTERNRQDHLYLEGAFPFANVETRDPVTGVSDNRLARCQATTTCPVSAEVLSSNEYWVKAGSLLHTTPDGMHDLPYSRYTREYLISSTQHGRGDAASKSVCQQNLNPLDAGPVARALFIALDEWMEGRAPPPSRVPTLGEGTLVSPLPQSAVGFPTIPGVTYTGLATTRYVLDFGPDYRTSGIAAINPPRIAAPYQDNARNGPIYPSFVPKTDGDGNDLAGVRLVDVSVPLATYTGWALRSGPQANDGCEAAGQSIRFAKTRAERTAAGDPRPAIEERYPSFDVYRVAVLQALDDLVRDRLMLCEDADAEQTRLFEAGLAHGVPSPADRATPVILPHCRR
jgi:hypothetical protein